MISSKSGCKPLQEDAPIVQKFVPIVKRYQNYRLLTQKRKSHSRFPFLFCRRQSRELHNYMQLTLHYISLFRRTSSSLHARNTANEEQLLYASSPVFQRPALEADSCRKYNSWTLVQLELRSNSKLSAIPSSLRSPYAHYQNEVFMRISQHKCLIFLHF